MQIKNINSINDIGRIDYTFQNDVYFDKKTIIYGENATGKTTLCACLKALFSRNLNYIYSRKNINTQKLPNFQITFKDGSNDISFSLSDNKLVPSVEGSKLPLCYIFDKEYIRKYLFTEEPTKEHQENMFLIYLGELAPLNKLRNKAKELKKKAEDKSNLQITIIKTKYNKIIDTNLLQYIKKNNEEIKILRNKDISTLEKEIFILESIEKIIQLSDLRKIERNPIEFDFKNIKDILSISFKDLQEDARAKFKQHLDSCFSKDLKEKAKEFISIGVTIQNKKSCPFCNQDYSDEALSLIDLYESVLSKEVLELQNKIVQEGQNLKSLFEVISQYFQEPFEDLEKDNIRIINLYIELTKENNSLYKIISLPKLIPCKVLISELMESLREKYKNIHDEKINPEIQKHLDSFESFLLSIKENIDLYNKSIIEIQTKISRHKEKLKKDVLELDNKRQEVQLYKLILDNDFYKLKAYKKAVDRFTKKLTKIEASIDIEAETILQTKQDKTNEILKDFNVDFRIDTLSVGGDKRNAKKNINFVLLHKDNKSSKVPLTSDERVPSFKTFLSEGDKNVLSFAFFIANLVSKADIDKAIVIFDDPVSSFDLERCNTFGLILKKELENKINQLIVCSHDKIFLAKLLNNISKENRKIIEVKKNSNDLAKSLFTEITEDILLSQNFEYRCNLKLLLKARSEKVKLKEIKQAIRDLTEFFIKVRYANYIEEYDVPLGPLIKKIKEKIDGNLLLIFEDLNRVSKDGMHDNSFDPSVKMITKQDEAIPYINQVLKLYGEV